MHAVHVDSMGVARPVPHVDRFPPPLAGHGAQPMIPPPGARSFSFYMGAAQAYTQTPEAVTGHPAPGLPFNPSQPVPADGKGTYAVSWPVAGG